MIPAIRFRRSAHCHADPSLSSKYYTSKSKGNQEANALKSSDFEDFTDILVKCTAKLTLNRELINIV